MSRQDRKPKSGAVRLGARAALAVAIGMIVYPLPGCGLLLGNAFDVALSADAGADGPSDDGGSGVDASGPETGCTPDPTTCAGKCGQVVDCGALVDCGGCAVGMACGGGGVPNVCGLGTCVPSCVGIACGASDGCGSVCTEGACGDGQRCVSNVCVCDTTSCTGCCSAETCEPGTDNAACGHGGGACQTCAAAAICGTGDCGTCGGNGQMCCAGSSCASPLTCGGGGQAAVCGCTPSCVGKGCGADDGCGGTCMQGSCLAGQTCAGGVCACDTASCAGCCSGSTCAVGTDNGACGQGGAVCVVCSGATTCGTGGTGGCGTCGGSGQTCCAGNACASPLTCGGSGLAGVCGACPSGTYTQSCTDIECTSTTLTAECSNDGGAIASTELPLPCAGAITNCNGQLTCGACPTTCPLSGKAMTVIDDGSEGGSIAAILQQCGRAGDWFTFHDPTATQAPAPGAFFPLSTANPPNSVASYVETGGTLTNASPDGGYGAGLGFDLNDATGTPENYDVTQYGYTGISFWIRANEPPTLQTVILFQVLDAPTQATNNGNYYFQFHVPAPPEGVWTHYSYTWGQLTQDIATESALQLTQLRGVQWQINNPVPGSGVSQPFDVAIGDVEFTQ
jgi:hypothetical protein